MRNVAYWLTGILLIILIVLAGLSVASRKEPDLGISEGRLTPCPDSPNCVSSEESSRSSSIPPLTLGVPADQSWTAAKEAVRLAGGKIHKESDDYLWATFTTRILHFTDDLEMRRDLDRGLIQIRSASRVGRSDFGANRRRVEIIKDFFCNKTNGSGPERPCQ